MRPNNLLLVGEWNQSESSNEGFPAFDVQGADIFVDNTSLGVSDGSSFSTPVISAAAEYLFRKGLTMDQVVKQLKSSCTPEMYIVNGLLSTKDVLVFNDKSLEVSQK